MNRTALAMMLLAATPVTAAPSCLADVGRVRAQAYVDACLFFSGATHPPCNVANECAVMQAEIDRNCTDKAKCAVPQVAGTWRCGNKACTTYSFTPTSSAKRPAH